MSCPEKSKAPEMKMYLASRNDQAIKWSNQAIKPCIQSHSHVKRILVPGCAFAGIRIVISEGIVHKAVNPELVQKGLWMFTGTLAAASDT